MSPSIEPVIFTAEELNYSIGEQILLKDASLSVHKGERIGLVGRNGCGKSTFMKIIAGIEDFASGNVIRTKGLSVGFLPQEFELDNNKDIYNNIIDGLGHYVDLLKEYETIPHDSKRFHDIEEEITRHDAWNLDYKVKSLMNALNTPPGDRPCSSLSGGEKRRVALAKAIISEPDLLILDEPTNHLDTSSIEWLENFLGSYNGTCIFVTHDRYFLDRIGTRTVELANGSFFSYDGNYTTYLDSKAEREFMDKKQEQKRQSFLRKELEWIRRGPKARTTKANFRVDRFYEVAGQKAPEKEMNIELIIPPAPHSGNKTVNLKNVTIGYQDTPLFPDFSFEFEPGQKIGIIGKNGVGKTTLLRTLMGQHPPLSGEVEISHNTSFNYVDQERIKLNPENTVKEEIGEGNEFVQLGDEKISIWGYLKRFLFSDERIRTKVGKLSGGEKGRLMLAKILKRGGNFIILDEPTNDLDLPTLRLLEEALCNFDGTVMIVSHDRYFLNRVCNSILGIEENGQLIYNVGNYNDYIAKVKSHMIEPSKPEKKQEAPKPTKPKTGNKKKLSWKEERELESIEDTISEKEEELEELEQTFSKPDFFKQHKNEVQDLQEKMTNLQSEVKILYNRWEELESLKD